ncbi:MAG: FAD-binding oxidoreductase, partial [Myxococcaceae bacterium]
MKPRSTAEVQTLMRQAFQDKTRIYPISAGKNWGNGSKTPWAPNCLLLDLSQLNQISDFNEELGFVTVGPGVTQIQLVNFLKKNNSKLMPSLTGSSRYASLIGNALERGDGFGAYGEHASYICHLELVLPNGELIYTGFKPGSACAKLSKASLGPSLDGLFFQSNLGVITEATIWLEPQPDYFHQAIFEAESLPELGELINTVQK